VERDNTNLKKSIYYDDKKVILKDAKDNILGVFPLRKVSYSDIHKLRHKIASLDPEKIKKGIFIIRRDNAYFIAVIPKTISFTSIACKHLCSNCTHCYASSQKGVGCPKISDRHFEETIRNNSVLNAIKFSTRLEKYPFILTGFETFGCNGSDIFVVSECKHFCDDSRKPKEANPEVTEKLFSTYKILSNENDVPPYYMKRRKKVMATHSIHPYQ